MKKFINKNLYRLSTLLPCPIYVVGGFVRNYLITGKPSGDVDLATPLLTEEILPIIKDLFINVVEYKNTGTIKFTDKDSLHSFELTTFRKESYRKGGFHTPDKIEFTTDILKDATRRDFKINAIYYDILKDKIIDPLDGIKDINDKIISTVQDTKEVFASDGLRLMRLARLKGELGFDIEKNTFLEAKKYAKNILDISKERIFEELNKILLADTKYSFSPKYGHYQALKVLDETGVLDYILPELTLGRNMEQRKDYHNFDVLEHSLKTVQYADSSIRLASLLHDVGKPYALKKDGNFYSHAIYGEKIASDILNRLKAPKKTVSRVKRLVSLHMLDMDLNMRESKIRSLIVKNLDIFFDLLLLKEADGFSCKEDFSKNPTVIKWQKIYDNMKKEGVPFSIKELSITGEDLIGVIPNNKIGFVLQELLYFAITDKKRNKKEVLLKKVEELKRTF